MRKSSFLFKRVISIVMMALLLAGTISGCEYSSVDDYLEELGLKDPDFSETQDDVPSSGSAQATVTDPVQDMQIGLDWELIPGDDNEDSEGAMLSSALNSASTQTDMSGQTDASLQTDETGLTNTPSVADSSTGDSSVADSSTGDSSVTDSSTGDSSVVDSPLDDSSALGTSAQIAEGTGSVFDEELLPDKEDFEFDPPKTSHALSEEEMVEGRERIGLTDDAIAARKKEQEGLYAYERLTDAGRTLYVEMLIIMENIASDIMVSTTSDEALGVVYDYVMADHPEIFYVSGYHYTNYTVAGKITAITFTGNYDYTPEEVASRKARINAAVAPCLSNAPSSSDEYFIIKYVYDYLINNTEYDLDALDNQNICSVFLEGKSVCNGYAKAAQYLLSRLGVKSTFVTGYVNTKSSRNVRHAWNLVECNGAYYYLDVTWGDASYQTVSGETADSSKFPEVNYDYLNVTTQEISRTHTAFDTIAMPTCTSMQDNYYVREDEYFTSAEMSLVGELFDRRYRDGSNNVTIKCASDAVYDTLFEELITNRKVFDYIQGDNSQISYTTFPDTRTIMFWI